MPEHLVKDGKQSSADGMLGDNNDESSTYSVDNRDFQQGPGLPRIEEDMDSQQVLELPKIEGDMVSQQAPELPRIEGV